MGNQLLSRPVYILAKNFDHFKKIKSRLNEVILFGYEPIYLDGPDRIRGVRNVVVYFEESYPPTDYMLYSMHRCTDNLIEVKMKEAIHG